jgi:hypothetical protein
MPPQKLDLFTTGDEYESVAAILWGGGVFAVVKREKLCHDGWWRGVA